MRDAFRGKGSAIRNLGCTLEAARSYLEARFQPGMTWLNWGLGRDRWNVDHVRPLASFDLSDPEQFAAACHHSNLQPLWWRDNLEKSDAWTG